MAKEADGATESIGIEIPAEAHGAHTSVTMQPEPQTCTGCTGSAAPRAGAESGTVSSAQGHHNTQEAFQDNAQQQPIKKGLAPEKRRMFGIPREKTDRNTGPILPDDYEKRYPPDEFGQEMGPNARVWRVYLDEAELTDRDMVEGWKDGVDVLLVFAGLFSAVVTTFVTQTSQKLDVDYSQLSASLLIELIAIQRAAATGSSLDNIPPSNLSLTSPQSTGTDAWVNGLWFTSLALSLITALFAVLIKQWIQHYVSFVSGTPLERARIHQFRYTGLRVWGVSAIIGILPLLLYAALFLFILGLFLFLRALKPEIAYAVGALGVITFTLYLVTNVLPAFYPQCPYRTPLIEHAYATISLAIFACRRIPHLLVHQLYAFLINHGVYTRNGLLWRLQAWCKDVLARKDVPVHRFTTLKAFESQAAKSEQDKVVQEIIEWILTISSNPTVKPIALQSLSGLYVGFTRLYQLFGWDALVKKELVAERERHLPIARLFGDEPDVLVDSPQFYNTERILRACMYISRFDGEILGSPWGPANWELFDDAVHALNPRHDFWQALATYRVGSIRSEPALSNLLRKLSPLSLLAPTTEQDSAAWAAWSSMRHSWLKYPLRPETMNISTIYTHIGPFCRILLSPESSDETGLALLPLLCYVLPQDMIEASYDGPHEYHSPSPKTLPAAKTKFCHMLLLRVILEWDTDNMGYQHSELENIVGDTCNGLYKAIQSYEGEDAVTLIQQLKGVLSKLVDHQGFSHCEWHANTYRSLFKVYINVFKSSSQPLIVLSVHNFPSVLAKAAWTYSHLTELFESTADEDILSTAASEAVAVLEEQTVNDLIINSAFDAFLDLTLAQRYMKEVIFSPSSRPWPSRMQPLVQWMLEYVTDYGENQVETVPFANDLSTYLIGRPGFLAFVCSSLLIDWSRSVGHEVVVIEDTSILTRLAKCHQNKPGAIDAWRDLLSWIHGLSEVICNNEPFYQDWTRVEFGKYERMADLVDELISIFKLDESQLKVPRFDEDDIIKFLKARRRPTFIGPLPDSSFPEPSSRFSVFRKLLSWRGPCSGDMGEHIDLESNPSPRGNEPVA